MSVLALPRNVQIWGPGYLASLVRRTARGPLPAGTIDVLFCVADHYEPDHGGASLGVERQRVGRWLREYPRQFGRFRDSDGCAPRHTFFVPLERYQPEHLDRLAELCHAGYGEVEVHLHHDRDSSAALRTKLTEFRDVLHERHRLLSIAPDGHRAYGFIHGNWALDNARPDGRWCGVNDELTVLRETGCYADFTMPSAPDATQTRIVNSIYYATDDPDQPRSHDTGVRTRVGGSPPPASLLMVQGPLSLRWRRRFRGVLPRIEATLIDHVNVPTLERFAIWVNERVVVEGRPEWIFVKVHSHGAPEKNADILLGSAMTRLHEQIARRFNDGTRYRLHYVTAREMVNIIKAAEQGETGNPGRFRDYHYRTRHDQTASNLTSA